MKKLRIRMAGFLPEKKGMLWHLKTRFFQFKRVFLLLVCLKWDDEMIGMIRSLSFFEHQIGWVCFISVKRVGFLIQKKSCDKMTLISGALILKDQYEGRNQPVVGGRIILKKIPFITTKFWKDRSMTIDFLIAYDSDSFLIDFTTTIFGSF